jgi:hypothetical protein
VGLWILMQMPALRQNRLMGGDLSATLCFAAAVLLAIWLMHQLAAIALGDATRPTLRRAALLLVVVIFLMTAVLRGSRPESHVGPLSRLRFEDSPLGDTPGCRKLEVRNFAHL